MLTWLPLKQGMYIRFTQRLPWGVMQNGLAGSLC
jgi:hypothetical protein